MERQPEANLLVLLDEIIEQEKGQWGTKETREKVKRLVTDPLIQKMQQEKRSNNALPSAEKIGIKSLPSSVSK